MIQTTFTELDPVEPRDINLDSVLAPRAHVGYVPDDDKGFCYDAEFDVLHVLSPTASIVWERLDGKTTLYELAEQLAQQFSANDTTVRGDVLSIVHDFAVNNLLGAPKVLTISEPTTAYAEIPSGLLANPPGG